MNEFERALELREDTVENRRFFHKNAECGVHMPKAVEFVTGKLREYGLDPRPLGEGVTATLGFGTPVLLLRADMDALPMPEESGLEFACPTGTENHACGHDCHAAMLLTAARMLKEREGELHGTVRFMFQPGEETFEGSRNMIENGILENPAPDAALAFHTGPGKLPVGLVMYNDQSTMMFSTDIFKITIKGRGGHGAYPHTAVDPINIGVHVHLGLQELIARESDPQKSTLLTVGHFESGATANIIPDTAVLEGTIRTNDREARDKLLRRIRELTEGIAAAYGGSAVVEIPRGVPPLVCDGTLVREMVGYIKEVPVPGLSFYQGIASSASEDFALVAERIPTAFIYLASGFSDSRGDAPAHNPKVMFNEDVLPVGAALITHCAVRWLESQGSK